jgi:hypothetical protein
MELSHLQCLLLPVVFSPSHLLNLCLPLKLLLYLPNNANVCLIGRPYFGKLATSLNASSQDTIYNLAHIFLDC